MDDKELKRIEISINNLFKIREHFINVLLLIVSGSLGLILTSYSIFKVALVLLGFVSSYLILLIIIDCNKKILNNLKRLK